MAVAAEAAVAGADLGDTTISKPCQCVDNGDGGRGEKCGPDSTRQQIAAPAGEEILWPPLAGASTPSTRSTFSTGSTLCTRSALCLIRIPPARSDPGSLLHPHFCFAVSSFPLVLKSG